MRKVSKLLVLLVLVVALVFAFSVKVEATQTLDLSGYTDLDSVEGTTTIDNAEDDKDDYEEVEDESKTEEDDDKKAEEDTKKETDTADKADTEHPQTGSFDTVMYVSIATIAVAAIILAYVKLKKYNY